MKFPSFKKSLEEELLTWWGVCMEQISTIQPLRSMPCSGCHRSFDNLSDPQAKHMRIIPVLRSFIHRVMILRGLKIACSLIFSKRTEDQGSWVGSSTHGYILIPSSLKTTLLWESLTKPCNKCILK